MPVATALQKRERGIGMAAQAMITGSQTDHYSAFYGRWRRLRRIFRFDVRYRCRRVHELFRQHAVDTENKRVLDVGFGGGELLASFPSSCELCGVDVSSSAVATAREDELFASHSGSRFEQIGESTPEDIPDERFDLVVSSHMLEHAPDDEAVLRTIRARMPVGGVLAVFVPVEEPDYILLHLRTYSVQSIADKIRRAGFEVLHTEGSMYINGHIWKILTIPSRRRWPVFQHLSDALRLVVLSSIPYRLVRLFDGFLFRLGFGARQAFVLARAASE